MGSAKFSGLEVGQGERRRAHFFVERFEFVELSLHVVGSVQHRPTKPVVSCCTRGQRTRRGENTTPSWMGKRGDKWRRRTGSGSLLCRQPLGRRACSGSGFGSGTGLGVRMVVLQVPFREGSARTGCRELETGAGEGRGTNEFAFGHGVGLLGPSLVFGFFPLGSLFELLWRPHVNVRPFRRCKPRPEEGGGTHLVELCLCGRMLAELGLLLFEPLFEVRGQLDLLRVVKDDGLLGRSGHDGHDDEGEFEIRWLNSKVRFWTSSNRMGSEKQKKTKTKRRRRGNEVTGLRLARDCASPGVMASYGLDLRGHTSRRAPTLAACLAHAPLPAQQQL